MTSLASKILLMEWFATVFSYLMLKWIYLKYFEIFKIAAILRSEQSFKPDLALEIEYNTTIGHTIPYILSFCSTIYFNSWRSYGNFKIWPIFLPHDLVIWPLTNNICRLMWRTRLQMWTKFSDVWCVAENMTIYLKHAYRRPSLTSRCDVVSDVINIENTFSGIISDDLSIFVVKLNLSKIFRNFPNGRHFDVRANFVTGSPTGSWLQSNSLHF